MNKFTFHYVNDVYWVTIPIYMYSFKLWCVVWWMYIVKNLLSFFISKLMEFSIKTWNFHGFEWRYRSDEAGCYISGIRASRTFSANELWVVSLLYFSVHFVVVSLNAWCLLFAFGTYSPCCVSMSYRDLIVGVITWVSLMSTIPWVSMSCHELSNWPSV